MSFGKANWKQESLLECETHFKAYRAFELRLTIRTSVVVVVESRSYAIDLLQMCNNAGTLYAN